MVITDLMGRVSMLSKWMICCSLLILNLGNQLQSQTLVCDGQINVSLGEDCDLGSQITPSMILQGIVGSDCDYEIFIAGQGLNSASNAGAGICYAEVFNPGNYSVTVTNGNNSCWGNILAEDKLGPQVDCSCDDPTNPCLLPSICTGINLDAVIPPTATDCDGIASRTFRDQVTEGGCGEASFLTRTWTFVDNVGNVSTCRQYYQSEAYQFEFDANGNNLDLPDDDAGIECPETEVDLPCGAGTSPEEIYNFFYTQYREEFPPSSDPPSEEYLLNNHAFATRHAYPYLASYVGGVLQGVSILEGTACNLFTTFEDTELAVCDTSPECSGNNKVIREWKIFDWCSPTSEPFICTQVIEAVDTEAPTFMVSDFTSSVDPWGCTGRVYFPQPRTIADNCSPTSALQYVVSTGSGTTDLYGIPTGSGTSSLQGVILGFDPAQNSFYAENVPIGEHEFYYNAWDCCTNIGSEKVSVSIMDATPPVAITKQDVVVSLIPNPGSLVEPGITKIFAESIDNGSFDGCGNVKLEIRRESDGCNIPSNLTYNNDGHSFDDEDDFDNGDFVQFCCNDLQEFGIDENGDGINDYAQIQVWLRVWDDGDGNGIFGSEGDNFSEVWSYVRLEDKSRPTILCPADVTVDCDGDPFNINSTGEATAFNSCGVLGTTFDDIESDLSNCSSGTITRRWFVNGNESVNCLQRITKNGSTSETIVVEFPQDTIITCAESVNADEEIPTWVAGACDQIAFNVERDTFFFQDGACFKILNFWTVINWCDYDPSDPASGGIWSQVQVVKIVDDSAPVIACPTGPVTTTLMGSSCSGPVMLTSSATDQGLCASNSLTWEAQVDLFSDGNIDYTYSSFNDPTGNFYIPASSSGEEVKITVPEGAFGEHRVSWKVSDGCGNNTTCIYTFNIADEIPPTPYCVNLSSSLTEQGSVELWACDFNLGAFDNCTPEEQLRFTFTDTPPSMDTTFNALARCSAREFNCDDIVNPSGSIVSLNIYVWDANNNRDFCTVFLTLVDNHASCEPVVGSRQISGNIATEEGSQIEDVQVELMSNQPQFPSMDMTDNLGRFLFQGITDNEDYEISNLKNDQYLNGVSTIDLVMIQRHILGLEVFESPYKLIAADINNDEAINGLDLVELRKLILGIYLELPQNDSWRFISAEAEMDIQYPWPLNEIRMILGLDQDRMQEDFIGVKIGDVNASAVANSAQGLVSNDSAETLNFEFADVNYEDNDIVEMKITTNDIKELSGMQFTLNTEGLEVVDITTNGIEVSEANYAVLSEGLMTFSWNTESAFSGNELFTIQFRAKQSGTLSENVSISSDVTPAEAYAGNDLSIIPITLIGQDNSEQEFALYQNSPNPFNGATDISFNLPEASNVTLTVNDVDGKLVWKHTAEYQKGLNNVSVDVKDLSTSGLFYYKLETETHSATMKMIVLK